MSHQRLVIAGWRLFNILGPVRAARESTPPFRERLTSGKPRLALIRLLTAIVLSCWFWANDKSSSPYLDYFNDLLVLFAEFPIIRQAAVDLAHRKIATAFCMAATILASLQLNDRPLLIRLVLLVLLSNQSSNALSSREGWASSLAPLPLHNPDPHRCEIPQWQETSAWLSKVFVFVCLVLAMGSILIDRDYRIAVAVLAFASTSILTASTGRLFLASINQLVHYGVAFTNVGDLQLLSGMDVVVIDETVVLRSPGINNSLNAWRDERRFQQLKCAVQTLCTQKILTTLFTAELRPAAELLANQIGIDRFEAELFPADKPYKVQA